MAYPDNELFDFAYIPVIEQQLEYLSHVAMDENWGYRYLPNPRPKPILYNYLKYTFSRLKHEGKIEIFEDQNACFNTGLATENQEAIFAFFEINSRAEATQKWYFKRFCKESDYELSVFNKLPETAHYFEDPAELLYDTRLELRPNLNHIVNDNRDRFPEPWNDVSQYQTLILLLEGATRDAIKRVKRNYKTAIPQFYKDYPAPGEIDKSGIQLLLPLCLKEKSKADLALVVHRLSNVYVATTVLSLDWAYSNARLIARPDTEWLDP